MSQKLVMMRHLGFDQEYSLPDNCKATIEDGNTLCIYQEVPDPWTGEGLPPVGAVCEVDGGSSGDGWGRCVISYSSPDVIVFKRDEYDFESFDCAGGEYSFRPVRTPEQIAAEEIQRIREEIGYQRPQLGPCPVEQMYLLGYRKFEIVENEE